MKTAPKIFELVTISSQVTPVLTLPIIAVIAYDSSHDAWQVGTSVACERRCEKNYITIHDEGTHSCWVRRHEKAWLLYNINEPLALQARG